MKKLFVFLFVICLFFKVVLASGIIVAIPSEMDKALYSGDPSEIVTGTLKNDNIFCDLEECTCETSQGEECTIGYPIKEGQTSNINFYVKSPNGCCSPEIVQINIRCKEYENGFCNGVYSNTREISFSYNWCGDNKCTSSKEDCSSCPNDCGKCDGEPCSAARECRGGYCVHNVCSSKPYIIGDGYCDPEENCVNSKDCSCKPGKYCEPNKKICVECYTNTHCDNNPQVDSNTICSGDNSKTITTTKKSYEICNLVSNSCEKKTDISTSEENCGENLCQNNHCGCEIGYFPCVNLEQCVTTHDLKAGEYCGCDFQCEENICEGKVCLKGLVTEFKTDKKFLKPGDSAMISLGINNPLDMDIKVDAVINLGSGTSASFARGEDCSSNQCKIAPLIPAYGRKEVSVELVGNEIGEVLLESDVKYNYNGRSIPIAERIKVTFTECGNEDCTPAITKVYGSLKEKSLNIKNYKIPYTVIIGVLTISVIILIILGVYKQRKHIPILLKELKPTFGHSIADEIEKLSRLHEKKVITKQEFEKHKKGLLKRYKQGKGLKH